MIFFTDVQTTASNYCLLNINKYDKFEKYCDKKIVFIDPSVMELRTQDEYTHIDQLHYLAQGHLRPNEYLSIDYPCDMVPRDLPQEEYQQKCQKFVDWSIANNWKYAENLQYICTIQYDWMVYDDFVMRMQELEPIYAGKQKIVGLGNLCRLLIQRSEMRQGSDEYHYFNRVINYLIQNKAKFYWIHIYGMSLFAIKEFMPLLQSYMPNVIFSVDSTKWTRVCNNKLHSKYVKPKTQTQLFPTPWKQTGIACTRDTRDEFFLENIKMIQRKNIEVKY